MRTFILALLLFFTTACHSQVQKPRDTVVVEDVTFNRVYDFDSTSKYPISAENLDTRIVVNILPTGTVTLYVGLKRYDNLRFIKTSLYPDILQYVRVYSCYRYGKRYYIRSFYNSRQIFNKLVISDSNKMTIFVLDDNNKNL